MSVSRYKIAIIQGDGVGPEIIPEALRALKTLQELDSSLDFDRVDVAFGATKYKETGAALSYHNFEIGQMTILLMRARYAERDLALR